MFLRFICISAGIRQVKDISKFIQGRYKIKLSIGDIKAFFSVSEKSLGHSYNVTDGIFTGYIDLPSHLKYWPSLFIKLIDMSHDNPVVIAATTICKPEKYVNTNTNYKIGDHLTTKQKSFWVDLNKFVLIEKPLKRRSILKWISILFINLYIYLKSINKESRANKDYSWWTKYYNSLDDNNETKLNNKHKLVIYPKELELQNGYQNFNDWANSIPLYYVDTLEKKNYQEYQQFCELKASIAFKKCEGIYLSGSRTLHIGQFSK